MTSGGATSRYNYDAAGNEISLALPASNGYTESRVLDRAGRVTEVKNANATSTLSQYDYAYDAAWEGDADHDTCRCRELHL